MLLEKYNEENATVENSTPQPEVVETIEKAEEVQSRPIQMRIYHSNERRRISAILRHRKKLF